LGLGCRRIAKVKLKFNFKLYSDYYSLIFVNRAYDEASKHCIPRAIVVINPGNPTGQLLSEDNIKAIIKWAHANKIFIMADEVSFGPKLIESK
jgi:histidinol-phosphate/aromatic aminotransferase/cobyric acid decarboxylase-like protein